MVARPNAVRQPRATDGYGGRHAGVSVFVVLLIHLHLHWVCASSFAEVPCCTSYICLFVCFGVYFSVHVFKCVGGVAAKVSVFGRADTPSMMSNTFF